MRAFKELWNVLTRWRSWLAVALALCVTLTVRADQFPADPVEELRQLVRSGREDLIKQRIEKLRSISEIRRALYLQEWGQAVSEADRRNRQYLLVRLQTEVRRTLQSGSAAARLAAMTIVAEMGLGGRATEGRLAPVVVSFPVLVLVSVPVPVVVVSAIPVTLSPEQIARSFGPDFAELVRSGDTPGIREAAAQTLGQVFADPQVAVPALSGLLDSRNVAERRMAVKGLAGLMRVATQLTSGTKTASGVDVRLEVVGAHRLALPVASRGLVDPDSEVRRYSAEAVHQTASSLYNLVPHLRQEIQGKKDLRAVAAYEEDTIGPARADLPPLMQGLMEQSKTMAEALGDPDLEVRDQMRRAMEDLGSARERLQQLNTSLADIRIRKLDGEENLLAILERALPGLIANVGEPNVQAKLGAIDVFEKLGPAAAPAAPALVKALSDQNRFVRWAAARTLSKVGPVEAATAVPGLTRMLTDPDLNLAVAAARTLESYGSAARAAVPDLITALNASDAEMRLAAMRALEGIGTDSRPAIPALSAGLSDPDPRVRQAAAETLGKFGASAAEAEPALRRALSDSSAEVRKAASDALLNMLQK